MMLIYILQVRKPSWGSWFSSISAHSSREEAEASALILLNSCLEDHGYPPQTQLSVAEQMCCDLDHECVALYRIEAFEMFVNFPYP